MPTKDNSEFRVALTKILDIQPHPDPNTLRLEVVTVYGFQVITQKNKYKIGDFVFYIPIDSILDSKIEQLLFPENSKIKLHGSRIRQIKIRGFRSQGMIVDPKDFIGSIDPPFVAEVDYSINLGITKYEPPQQRQNNGTKIQKKRNKQLENPRFHKYNGVNNIKWCPQVFENKEVIIQEKLHGSNSRLSYLPASNNTFWKKIKNFFGLLPKYEYCWGSNNVQLQERRDYQGFYGGDIYYEVFKKLDAFSKLKPGETVYGELIGKNIQKNYDYGHKEHHFVLFDVKVEREDGTQEYLDPEQAEAYAKDRGFDFVPVLYRGLFDATLAKELSMGPSVYCPNQKVREGIVIKARTGYGENSNKKAYKLISEIYLEDTSNTDFQ